MRNGDGSITVSARRIKFTYWLAEAWKAMQTKQESITAAFFACGMGAIDGSDDKLIKIGEEKDYKVELYDSEDDGETDSDDDTLEVKKSVSEKKKGTKTVAQDSKQASADGNDVIDLVEEKELTPKKLNTPDNSGLDSKHGKGF